MFWNGSIVNIKKAEKESSIVCTVHSCRFPFVSYSIIRPLHLGICLSEPYIHPVYIWKLLNRVSHIMLVEQHF